MAGHTVQVVDSTGRVFYQQPASGAAAPASADTLPAGQSLTQGTKLYSQSGQYYLVPQSELSMCLPVARPGCMHRNLPLPACRRRLPFTCARLLT